MLGDSSKASHLTLSDHISGPRFVVFGDSLGSKKSTFLFK